MRIRKIINWLYHKFYFPGFPTAKKKLFYFNIAIGIIFAVLLTLVIDNTQWGEDNLNNIFDSFFIKREAQIMGKRDAPEDIVFIEIDEETYREWGEPIMVPRDAIARAIKTAYRGGAKVIYPDILLEHENTTSGDRELRDLLQNISREERDVNIIFPVRIGYRRDRKPNIFDDLINQEENFYRAVPGVVSSDIYENTIRYWRGYEDYYQNGRDDKEIVWGVPLLASVLAEGNVKELNSFIDEILAGKDTIKKLNLASGKKIKLSTLKEDFFFQRIRFTIFHEDVLPGKPEGNLNIKNVININQLKYFENDKEVFKDKIVIIGNSSPDTGDIHVTPVGKMVGMYIVGNAINTLISGKQTARASWFLNLLFFLIIILITAYFFTYFHAYLANVLGTLVLSYIFIREIGFYFYFNHGIFLISIVLVVIIGFYEIIDDIKEVAVDFNEKRKEKLSANK